MRSPLLPSSEDGYVIRRSFARTAIPRDQQVTVWNLNNAGRVIVLVVQREDKFAAELRILGACQIRNQTGAR